MISLAQQLFLLDVTFPCKLQASIVHFHVLFQELPVDILMSLYGSFPVSVVCIMDRLNVFCYQQTKQVNVGKGLQDFIFNLRVVRGQLVFGLWSLVFGLPTNDNRPTTNDLP